ncbi:glycosyltransferase [Treponema sp. R80B11-R83G3]
MKNKSIIIVPFNETEQYLSLMIKAYRANNCCVLSFSINNLFKVNYLMLNWFENISYKNNLSLIVKFIKNITAILFFRVLNKKIIWTLHNRKPHRTEINKAIVNIFSKIIMKLLFLISYKIIIHSKAPVIKYNLSKFIYVPHPNFINFYGNPETKNTLTNEKIKLLFFGTIIPYKNLDILIQAINELNFQNLELQIAGKISDNYINYINHLIGNNNSIKTNFNFISNHDIPKLIANCHLVIVPFDLESCYNASTAILSFSYKRSVICTEIGTVLDIENKSLYFGYTYEERIQHKQRLKECISHVYNNYSGNYNNLLQLGEQCYNFINDNNNIEETIKSLRNIFI